MKEKNIQVLLEKALEEMSSLDTRLKSIEIKVNASPLQPTLSPALYTIYRKIEWIESVQKYLENSVEAIQEKVEPKEIPYPDRDKFNAENYEKEKLTTNKVNISPIPTFSELCCKIVRLETHLKKKGILPKE